jgi:lantibiotic modifying enzyme
MKRVALLAIVLSFVAPPAAGNSAYLEAALDAARWIKLSALATGKGTVWPADPLDPKSISPNLYSGTPGVVLFFIEAYRSTGSQEFLKEARAGADYLASSYPAVNDYGLYTGLSGIAFALNEAHKVTRDKKHELAAKACLDLLRRGARKTGAGVEWNETTDIISGSAGIGLFLLYAAREMRAADLVKLAAEAGNRLIELSKGEHGGVKWAMTPAFRRLMPNFSHGTAGVAYFLATLYLETKEKAFLDHALAGARYLKAVARTEGEVCLVFHNEPDGKELYYLGWCHGPTGTARLFYQLYRATGDGEWMKWVARSARAVMSSGIPERRTPGFWNNVSQCCGSAGVAQFFLALHRATRDEQYLAFAKRMADDLLARATRDDAGSKWIQAEHRVRPELLVAQTGYMQGAAGIGILLLHLDAEMKGKRPSISFPDSPF